MVHPTADVSCDAVIGANTKIWHRAQIGGGAKIGDDCIIGSGVYVDRAVVVGNRVKIQTGAQLYRGTVVEDGVFIGPLVCFTNDRYPRAIAPDGRLKTDLEWEQGTTHVGYGASLGAGAIILPNVRIGRFALVAAGAVVVADVPDHGLVVGTPGRLVGYVCVCAHRLLHMDEIGPTRWRCPQCRRDYVTRATGGLRPQATREILTEDKPDSTDGVLERTPEPVVSVVA